MKNWFAGAPESIYPARYAPQCGRWRTGRFHAMPRLSRLRVVTWNILFERKRWLARLDILLIELDRLRAGLIALQEVTPRQLEHILAREWVRKDYATSDADGASGDPRGILLLSRPAMLEARLVRLPSQRGRKLLLVDIETGCGPLRCAVAHLESGREARLLRERQLALVAASQPGAMPALIVGDLNFDADVDLEESGLPADFLDCWRRLHPADVGKTLDPDANALRAELTRHGPKPRRALRCDRILLRPGPSDLWRPVKTRLVGTAPVASGADVLASDHFGLIATIDCNPHTTPGPQ